MTTLVSVAKTQLEHRMTTARNFQLKTHKDTDQQFIQQLSVLQPAGVYLHIKL